MTKINLLPWRETYRREKNNEFYVILAIVAALAAGAGFGGLQYANDKVQFQEKRNARLTTEIDLLQEELAAIRELESTKDNLLARMRVIQELQGQRPQIVHTFDEVATRLPDGVFLTAMKQSGIKQLILEGRAESNARVSALMRRMDRSEYFSNPTLDVIKANVDDGISEFKLSVTQNTPKADGEVEADDGAI